MANIKLENLTVGETIYCSLVENSSSGVVQRMVTATVTGPVDFQEEAAKIPTDTGGILVVLANRAAMESAWHTTEEAAIANPVVYARA